MYKQLAGDLLCEIRLIFIICLHLVFDLSTLCFVVFGTIQVRLELISSLVDDEEMKQNAFLLCIKQLTLSCHANAITIPRKWREGL